MQYCVGRKNVDKKIIEGKNSLKNVLDYADLRTRDVLIQIKHNSENERKCNIYTHTHC